MRCLFLNSPLLFLTTCTSLELTLNRCTYPGSMVTTSVVWELQHFKQFYELPIVNTNVFFGKLNGPFELTQFSEKSGAVVVGMPLLTFPLVVNLRIYHCMTKANSSSAKDYNK